MEGVGGEAVVCEGLKAYSGEFFAESGLLELSQGGEDAVVEAPDTGERGLGDCAAGADQVLTVREGLACEDNCEVRWLTMQPGHPNQVIEVLSSPLSER